MDNNARITLDTWQNRMRGHAIALSEFIPGVGEYVSTTLDFFWPEEQMKLTSVWETGDPET